MTIYLLVQVFVDDCILKGHKYLSLHFIGSQKKKCGVFIELSIEQALDLRRTPKKKGLEMSVYSCSKDSR